MNKLEESKRTQDKVTSATPQLHPSSLGDNTLFEFKLDFGSENFSIGNQEQLANSSFAQQSDFSLTTPSKNQTLSTMSESKIPQSNTHTKSLLNTVQDKEPSEFQQIYTQQKNGYEVQQTQQPSNALVYSIATISPTKKQIVDSNVIKQIRMNQQRIAKMWQGLNLEYIGKPGIQMQIQNNKKFAEYLRLEDERFRYFQEAINKFKEIDEERQLMEISPTKNDKGSGQNQNNSTTKEVQLALQLAQQAQEKRSELVTFKLPKDLQLVNREGNLVLTYQKPSNYYDQSQSDTLYKMHKADTKLVKATLETNGFVATEGHDWNIMWSSRGVDTHIYEELQDYQKINHFPYSTELTRKDRLIANLIKMQEKFGKEEFNIIPDSYILPDEFADFYSHFHSNKNKDQANNWIVKPQNSCQGKGIYIINDVSEVPIDEHCIISRYIQNPFLINGLKFDLRIYVLVTSYEPWRIYVYNDGLARFAVEQYDPALGKEKLYGHLTNFSLNKKNEKFVNNQTADQDDQGHKWSLTAITKYLEKFGVDTNLVWSRIYDVILKSLMSVDSYISAGLKKMPHKNNCFELLGFDILLDSDMKPWLMEVNISPSLATESPLDLKIKSNLFIDAINLMCLRRFDRKKENINKIKNRVKNIMRAKSYQSRQNSVQTNIQGANLSKAVNLPGDDRRQKIYAPTSDYQISTEERNTQVIEKVSQLNSKIREQIREILVEHFRRSNFIRIYPAKSSSIYDKYMTQIKPLNTLINKCLFSNEIIPFPHNYEPEPIQQIQTRSPVKRQIVPVPKLNQTPGPKVTQTMKKRNATTDFKQRVAVQTANGQANTDLQSSGINQQTREKLLITGDDILIEYVQRLMIAVQSIKESMIKPQWNHQIEKFVKHYVWHTSDVRRAQNNKLWQRLESRLIEMKERRKRLLQSIYCKERSQITGQQINEENPDYQADFLKEFQAKEAQKNVVIQGFSAAQLEEMLRTSTRNVAYEVISCLIDNGRGVLTEIIKFLTTSTNRYFVQEDSSSFLDSLQKRQNVIMPQPKGTQFRKPNQQIAFQGIQRPEGAEGLTEEEADTLMNKATGSKMSKSSTPSLQL